MQSLSIPFSTLLSQLSDPGSQVRLQAIKSIVARPAEREKAFVSLLALLLTDPDERVLKEAITALGMLGNGQAVPVLSQILTRHPLARVRLRALKVLRRLSSSQSVSPTLSALHDPSALVRRTAVGIVGRWQKPHTAHLLTALQGDPNAAVRARVAGVLQRFASSRIVDPLLVTLNNAEEYNKRGNAYRETGLYDQAIADFTQAIQLAPADANAYTNRGKVYCYNLRQYEQAFQDFDRAIQLQPDVIMAYYDRGSACLLLKQYDQALSDLSHVIEANEGAHLTSWACLKRGVVYLRKREYQPAIIDFERMLKYDSRNASAHNNLGCVHHFLGDYQLAIDDYNRALAFEPAQALYYSNRGEAYQCLAQFNQAMADFEFALALKPDLPNTRDFLERAKQGKQ